MIGALWKPQLSRVVLYARSTCVKLLKTGMSKKSVTSRQAHSEHGQRRYVESVLVSLVACPECDLLHNKLQLEAGAIARCVRCNAFLYSNRPNNIDRCLAVSLAALIMFIVANAFPFLAISVSGNTQSISIISAVFALSDEGLWLLGFLCFGFIIFIPLLRVVGLLYILLPLRFERRMPGMELIFRGIVSLSPWSMMEIYMLGAIVALVKLASMASIELGLSFWAFALLNMLSALAAQMVDRHTLWSFLSESRGGLEKVLAGRQLS